jgi:hypothetical protein
MLIAMILFAATIIVVGIWRAGAIDATDDPRHAVLAASRLAYRGAALRVGPVERVGPTARPTWHSKARPAIGPTRHAA